MKVPSLLKNSKFSIALILSLLTYVLSFALQLVISYYFGTSHNLDSYWIGLSLVGLLCFYVHPLREALAPAVYRSKFISDSKGAEVLSSGIILLLTLVSMSAIIFCIFFDQILEMKLIAIGNSRLAIIQLIPWLIIYMLLMSIAELFNSILISLNFVFSQNLIRLGSAIISLGIIFFLGEEINVSFLFLAQASGCLFVVLVALYILRGMRIRYAANWVSVLRASDFMPLFFSLLATYFFSQLYAVIERFSMLQLGGGLISGFQYSVSIVNAMVGILVIPLTNLLWPRFLLHCQRKEMLSAKLLAVQFSGILYLLMCFFSTFIYLHAKEIIFIIFSRGAFGEQSLELTSMALQATIFSSVPISMLLVLGRFLMSSGDASRQIWIGLASTLGGVVVIYVALSLSKPQLIVWHWLIANFSGLLISIWIFLSGREFSKRQILLSAAWAIIVLMITIGSALLTPSIDLGSEKWESLLALFLQGIIYLSLVLCTSFLFRLHLLFSGLWKNLHEAA